MSDNVAILPVVTRLPCPPERILKGAIKAHEESPFQRVLIIGVTGAGSEYFACSDPDGGTALWDMERTRHKLMKIVDDTGDAA